MVDLRFKVGDVIADSQGTIGEVIGITPESEFPYRIREANGATAQYKDHGDTRCIATLNPATSNAVNHPSHYGGADDPYEAIKVIEAWGLGFHLGNAVKYIRRAGKKAIADELEDLLKTRWYVDRRIKQLEDSK